MASWRSLHCSHNTTLSLAMLITAMCSTLFSLYFLRFSGRSDVRLSSHLAECGGLGRILYRTFASESDIENNIGSNRMDSKENCDDCSFTKEELQIPQNGGFLKTQAPSGALTSYGTSMFHRLHSVFMLEQHWSGAGHYSHELESDDSAHRRHCFSYLA